MKYSAVLLAFAVGVFALPQDQPSIITSAPASAASIATTPQASCLATCSPEDVTCRAQCVGVARPNTSQILETNECAAECDQGNGSTEQSKAYAQCLQDCYHKFFPSSQTLGAQAQVSSILNEVSSKIASATGGSAAASSSGASATGSQPTGSATGTAAQSSGTGAANSNKVQLAGVGLAGLALAVFGL